MIDRTGCSAHRHGTYTAYQRYRCRCPDAREDWRLYAKRRREGRAPVRRVDATGTIRRIQALFAAGHTANVIATRTTLSPDHILNVVRGRQWVTPVTANAVRRAYDALSMTPGASGITRRRAMAAGYPPPLAWDDEAIDDPAASPAGVGFIGRPRAQVYADARRDGMSIESAGRAAGISRLTARRYEYRDRARVEGAA